MDTGPAAVPSVHRGTQGQGRGVLIPRRARRTPFMRAIIDRGEHVCSKRARAVYLELGLAVEADPLELHLEVEVIRDDLLVEEPVLALRTLQRHLSPFDSRGMVCS